MLPTITSRPNYGPPFSSICLYKLGELGWYLLEITLFELAIGGRGEEYLLDYAYTGVCLAFPVF